MKLKLLWGNPFLKNKNNIDSDIDFISKIPLFFGIKKRGLSKIYPLFYVRHYKKDEIVFRQEDPGVGLYIIRTGGVSVYKEFNDLVKKEIAVLGEGDFFGEISLLNESFRSATIVASCDTVLLGLFKPELLGLMDSDPKLGQLFIYNIAQILAERLRLSSENT
jgi:CRP/FNR family transcriptional regulator, cyclic AMP receptor protein